MVLENLVAQDIAEENNRRPFTPPHANIRQSSNGSPHARDPAQPALDKFLLSSDDLDTLLQRHSFLAGYSRETLANNIDTILKLETTSLKLKNLEKGKDIADKLTQNRDELETTFYPISAGKDNRLTEIDPARFLPGLACLASKTWLESRSHISTKGHQAVSTYDMASVGLAGYVTNRGWVEIHNPGSSCMSLKMFSINNCGASSCKKSDELNGEEFSDILELGEFKCALRALREAMHQVHPWNLSISAVEGFLLQSNFCSADLDGLDKKASILTSFVDYVLKENSNRWRGRESFLTTPQLKGVWESFFGARPQSLLKGAKKQLGTNSKTSSTIPQGRKFDPKLAHLYKEDICVNFNLGRCIKAPGMCTTRNGRLLRHICNHRPDPTNPSIPCGANHAACYNH